MVRPGVQARATAAACGLLLDRLLGEPPAALHPVGAFGQVMGRLERSVYGDSRGAGVGYTTAGVALGYAAGAMLPLAIVVASTAAGHELRRTAAGVRDALLADDLDHARELVPALVGRDPSALDSSGVAAAVIESLAENTVDAVVAPVWWAVVGGAGAAGAYRAVNTMDAMVGHRSARYARFGWASARLDDAMNFLPARLTALLITLVRPATRSAVRRAIREQAAAHPSPNAGVAEAAFAAVLGVELGGPLRYGDRAEERPRLGWGPRPQPVDIDQALTLASHVELALGGLLLTAGLVRTPG
jgi:adenosylcobinamide-phosphate synthase